MASAQRAARLELRTTRAQKQLIKRAAELTGVTTAAYIVSHVQEAAAATIRNFESLSLHDEAREVFVQALLNPPEPNEALKAAVVRHQQLGL